MGVYGRGHGDNDYSRLRKPGRIIGIVDFRAGKFFRQGFPGVILAANKLCNAFRVHIKTGHVHVRGKGHGQRQPDITETDDGYRAFPFQKVFKFNHDFAAI